MYREDIDSLKGIAILCVLLFHIGLLKSGYLGVDVFFVINGFLLIPSVVKGVEDGNFSYFRFLEKRIVRLLPLIALASFACLILGYYLMLPDSLENLGQAVIASNFFSENILSAITTKNYWDISNDYKPLMHLWYVGVLMEFYFVLPLLVIILKKLSGFIKRKASYIIFEGLCIFTLLSLFLYLLPIDTDSNKFYYLPYRFFELSMGGLIALKYNKRKPVMGGAISWLPVLLLLVVVCNSLAYFSVDTIDNHMAPIGAKNILSKKE